MKKLIFVSFLALIGPAGILGLNSSEISKMGYGIELPIGWHEPPQTTDMLCTMQARFSEGLPFSYERPANCETATNTLAQILNALVGISIVAVIGAFVQNRLIKQR